MADIFESIVTADCCKGEGTVLMSHVADNELDLDSLTRALLLPSPVGGVYGRTGLFEQIIEGLSFFISRHREPETQVVRFPPVMSRSQLERSGYLHSFPHLLGGVSCLKGSEATVRALVEQPDWVDELSATDLVLSPAACYPVYPMAAAGGPIPADGLLFDVASDCFRHESTHEIGRFQSFRMREFVCIGTPEQVQEFRTRWMFLAQRLVKLLGLAHQVVPASDPFFGRAGRLAAMSQLEQSLKYELLIPLRSKEEPTACMSFNCHRDHFSLAWHLLMENGEKAHTGCVAFGLDRLALALFKTHGLDLRMWPALVRENLSI
jgi:seryl-tRNA synthetase